MEGARTGHPPRSPDDWTHRFPHGFSRDGSGLRALRKRDRATKDTTTDIDSLTLEERAEQLEDLELRDISDRKLRKVLRDLDAQVEAIKE